jgi:hypothetical protein
MVTNHATQAASAVWRIGSHTLLRRRRPERKRWWKMEIMGLALSRTLVLPLDKEVEDAEDQGLALFCRHGHPSILVVYVTQISYYPDEVR